MQSSLRTTALGPKRQEKYKERIKKIRLLFKCGGPEMTRITSVHIALIRMVMYHLSLP